jgi:hypothetical protein
MGDRDPEGRAGRTPSGNVSVSACACPSFRPGMHGVAQTLRGPMSAGWCPHPTGLAGAPCRQPGHGQRLRDGWHSPTRAWPFVDGAGAPALLHFEVMHVRCRSIERDMHERQPRTRKTARHRPVSTPRLAAGRRGPAQGPGVCPVAGQAARPKGPRDPPAELYRCLASSFVLPHVPAQSRRPSPRPARHVFGPSGSGSAWSMARGEGVGMKWGDFFGGAFSSSPGTPFVIPGHSICHPRALHLSSSGTPFVILGHSIRHPRA